MPTLPFTAHLTDERGLVLLPDVDVMLDVTAIDTVLGGRGLRVDAVYLDAARREVKAGRVRWLPAKAIDVLHSDSPFWRSFGARVAEQAVHCDDLSRRAIADIDPRADAADERRRLKAEEA